MDQGRDPPAFQEYAATMLSQIPFRVMSFAARGLLYTMRLECWVNLKLPRNPDQLAKVLGTSQADLSAMLPEVMPFFEIDGDFIFSPELQKYRACLDEKHRKQSEGGKRGLAARNGQRKTSARPVDKGDSSTLPSTPQVPRQAQSKSLVKLSTEQQSQNQSVSGADIHDDFIAGYESMEADASAYLRASRG
jgi:uncharacterized protein YdaU (DUF1376 family)